MKNKFQYIYWFRHWDNRIDYADYDSKKDAICDRNRCRKEGRLASPVVKRKKMVISKKLLKSITK